MLGSTCQSWSRAHQQALLSQSSAAVAQLHQGPHWELHEDHAERRGNSAEEPVNNCSELPGYFIQIEPVTVGSVNLNQASQYVYL